MSLPVEYTRHLSSCFCHEKNQRTGEDIAVSPEPLYGTARCYDQIPTIGVRGTSPHIAAAELAWQLLGTHNADFILRHAPRLWSKFTEPGRASKQIVAKAYGPRWLLYDQLDRAIAALRRDSTNRRCVVQTWMPNLDSPEEATKCPPPCPTSFVLSIVDSRLNLSLQIRSSDLVLGFPYDLLNYCLLLDALVCELGDSGSNSDAGSVVQRGVVSYHLAHAHYYSVHQEAVNRMCGEQAEQLQTHFSAPGWSIDQIRRAPDEYVLAVKVLAAGLQAAYHNSNLEVVV